MKNQNRPHFFVGLDLGGTFIKVGLVSEDGKILKKQQLSTYSIHAESKSRDDVLSQMQKGIEFALKDIHKKEIIGIGIGTPGLVDKQGNVFLSPNLPDWDNLPLKEIFQKKFSLPVKVENDVNTITWGEYVYGAGKGYKTIICITLGTGLGGGVVVEGKLLRGKFSAAELGHISIDYKGPKCNCGALGCVERFVGSSYIVERAVSAIKKSTKSKIYDLVKGDLDKITPKIIHSAAVSGDKLAVNIWEEVGSCVGTMLSGLVNIFNPELIVIGGGVSQAGEFIFSPIRKIISRCSFPLLAKDVKVVSAKLGADTGIVSAASLLIPSPLPSPLSSPYPHPTLSHLGRG